VCETMKMNRRQALIGIGSLAVGSGAALGSGAFTSVSAERDVDVNIVDDGNALLGVSVTGDEVSDTGTGTVAITFGDSTGFNDDAVTELGNVLELTNNGSSSIVASLGTGGNAEVGTADGAGNADGSDSVSVSIENDSNDEIAIVDFTLTNANDSEGVAISTNGSESVSATVYTGDRTSEADSSSPTLTDTLELIAQENSSP